MGSRLLLLRRCMAVSAGHGIRRKLYFRTQSMHTLNDLKSLEHCVVEIADYSCTFERESLECSIPCLNNKGAGIYCMPWCDGTLKTEQGALFYFCLRTGDTLRNLSCEKYHGLVNYWKRS
jgi:hypothetical protein